MVVFFHFSGFFLAPSLSPQCGFPPLGRLFVSRLPTSPDGRASRQLPRLLTQIRPAGDPDQRADRHAQLPGQAAQRGQVLSPAAGGHSPQVTQPAPIARKPLCCEPVAVHPTAAGSGADFRLAVYPSNADASSRHCGIGKACGSAVSTWIQTWSAPADRWARTRSIAAVISPQATIASTNRSLPPLAKSSSLKPSSAQVAHIVRQREIQSHVRTRDLARFGRVGFQHNRLLNRQESVTA